MLPPTLAIDMNSEEVVLDIFSIQSEYAGESPQVKQACSKCTYKVLAKCCLPQSCQN